MKQIMLIRHGQSKAQIGPVKNELNPDLSDLGKKQAARLVNILTKQEFDLIMISPLSRVWQTFKLSGAKGRKIKFDSRLIEGVWGNRSYADILPVETPDFALADRQNAWLKDIDVRAELLMDDLMSSTAKKILLFGHWNIFNHLMMKFCGIQNQNGTFSARMDNAAISLFEITDSQNRILRIWNDTKHIDGLSLLTVVSNLK